MFEALRAKSFERLPDALTHGEYVAGSRSLRLLPQRSLAALGSLFAMFCRI
jgi:hypothetical protein